MIRKSIGSSLKDLVNAGFVRPNSRVARQRSGGHPALHFIQAATLRDVTHFG